MDMKTLKQFAYIGAFLSESERDKARRVVKAVTPMMDNEYLHHLTLLFKPKANLEAVERLLPWVGKEIQIKATGLAQCVQPGHQVQAFLCELPSGLYCNNKYPHITVSSGTKEDGKPVSPATSNSLFGDYTDATFASGIQLFGTHESRSQNQPLTLTARVGMFSHKKEVGIVYDLEEIQ